MQLSGAAAAVQRASYKGLVGAAHNQLDVECGTAARITVRAGDIVSVENVDGGAPVQLSALSDAAAGLDVQALGQNPQPASCINPQTFDSRELDALLANRNASWDTALAHDVFDAETEAGETFLTKIEHDATLFVIAPRSREFIASGGGGRFAVKVQRATNDAAFDIPEPLGRVVDEWRIDRGTAKAYEVKKGQFIQIIDVEGQQCSDFMAMRSEALDAGLERFIDSTVSRTMARAAYPQPGLFDKLYDQDIRPLLSVSQDTVGRHDTFALACTARGYEERGFPGHLNCSDNISGAFAAFGIKARSAWPAINLFFNSWIDDSTHALASDEAWSRPGDYVVLKALTDLVCVSTACPDDVDPINGWNPTDVHVRLYEENTSVTRAISWRGQPEDIGKLTRESPFHPRTSKLTNRFHVARDVWLASEYDATGAEEEYWACRNNATIQDMSSLLKYDIVGPDATELLQTCLTRDVSKLSQHRGTYALICDERGSVIDDGTLFRIEPTAYRWCCGSDHSALHLREQAERLGLKVWVRSLSTTLANLALQGPKSRDILSKVVFTQDTRPSLENLKWFGFTIARLHNTDGPMFMLSRTGFTGELGYEIFCDKSDATTIWDGLMEAGETLGLVPMGGDALAMLRIEAGLMISGAEFGPDSDAMESGLGFAVDLKKADFIGRAALERNGQAVRRKLVGLRFEGDEHPAHGDAVFVGREQVGLVTSATYSPELGCAIAMARIAVENANQGDMLEVGRLDGQIKRLPCTIVSLAFIDPKREKARS